MLTWSGYLNRAAPLDAPFGQEGGTISQLSTNMLVGVAFGGVLLLASAAYAIITLYRKFMPQLGVGSSADENVSLYCSNSIKFDDELLAPSAGLHFALQQPKREKLTLGKVPPNLSRDEESAINGKEPLTYRISSGVSDDEWGEDEDVSKLVPPKELGEVQFSCQFSKEEKALKVGIIGCKDLQFPSGSQKRMDPYVKLQVSFF